MWLSQFTTVIADSLGFSFTMSQDFLSIAKGNQGSLELHHQISIRYLELTFVGCILMIQWRQVVDFPFLNEWKKRYGL